MKNKIITVYELMGLIKDGKAPKKIKINNKIWFLYKSNKGMSYIDNEKTYLNSCSLNFNYYIEENKLNTIVEILLEENDEREDIEELKLQFGGDCKYRFTSENGTEYEFPQEIADKINQLIKNQKCLKEMVQSLQKPFMDEIRVDTPKWIEDPKKRKVGE